MFLKRRFDGTPEQEYLFHSIRLEAAPGMRAISESVLHDMAVLDSKSAALLTFISVVLAGLIFSLQLVESQAPYAHLIRGGIFVFMSLFAYAAWIDLRCLYTLGPSSFSPQSNAADFERVSIAEIAKRRNKYQFALYISETSFLLLVPFALIWMLVSARGMFF